MSPGMMLEPSAASPSPATEPELTVAVARWLAAHDRTRSGSREARVFGELVAAMRARRGGGRVELARRARLNPVYLSLLEMGVWGPAEIPAVAVAKLAVAFGRSLDELPCTPYTVGAGPGDEVQIEPGWARIRLGFEAMRLWSRALTGGPAVSIALPEITMPGLRIGSSELGNLAVPAALSDEYTLRLVREAAPAAEWWLHAHVTSPGLEVQLRLGAQRQVARADARGELHFERLAPEDIEPLELIIRT